MINYYAGLVNSDYFGVLMYVVPIMIIWLIYILFPRYIDVIVDEDDVLLFKIYQARSGKFYVKDYTGMLRAKLPFKTYVDLEAYIYRKLNGWNDVKSIDN